MGESRGVKSLETMFEIVEFLVETDGAGVTTIAKQLGLAKSTVHQQLSTLHDRDYVVKENEEYHVGLRFLSLGETARLRREAYHLVRPMVKQLAAETEERSQFFVEEHGRGVILYMEAGERGVKADRHTGKRRYLHSSAGGKAMLAHMSRDHIETIIDRCGLPAETENTITSREALFNELESVREQGYAVNSEESISGLRAVAAPVVVDGKVIGSFSIPGPRHRLETKQFRDELPDLLRSTANELEIKVKYA